MTDRATMNTKPQLEIWADDVKCSHGATTGKIDNEQLFYLQSRGIDKETAKAMLIYAFANDILENIQIEPLRLYLEKQIQKRLGKGF
jgi:Fe-S cluster assembly protein SufD